MKGSRRTTGLALAAALVAWPGAASGADPAPPCLVSSDAPARAYVGEQIVLEVRVLRRPDVSSATWLDGAGFPGFRADSLPGLSGETRVRAHGAAYLVFVERHALFPVRAGRLTLPAARLQCALHALPGSPPRAFVVQRESRTVDVREVPADGRPEGFAGLVGEVQVAMRAAPTSLRIGETLHLTVSYEGDADLRSLPPPFAGAQDVAGAELFAERPSLTLDPGRRLRLRRVFAFDVVPRVPGTLTIPSVSAPHFDPATARFGVATAPPLEIRVNPPGGG